MTFSCDKVGLDFFDAAPTIHRASIEVAATPERVFDLLLDANAWVTWAFPITRVDWTSGFPITVGSTRNVHMRGNLVGYEEFIAYEHGARMAFRFNEASKKGIRAFAEDYQVTDLGNGRCRVAWTMAMDTGREAGPIDKITNPVMTVGLKYMLGRFGKLIESDYTPAGVA
ncbi:SRPBCC family protein [Nocardioides sp.]|uniref:SRPBCC family protein n=1 Tax=Nocardioides sp. TaxID=35761 RepID=UPI003565F7F6